MEVSRGGKFSHTIGAKDLAQGLRKSKRAVRNSGTLITCQGAVGRDGVLQVIDEITRLTTSLITEGFPYPQLFVFTNVIIVCGQTKIYEWIDDALVQKISVTAGLSWKALDFFNYIYLSNREVAVYRRASSGSYFLDNNLPKARSMCNFNGQVLIGSPKE